MMNMMSKWDIFNCKKALFVCPHFPLPDRSKLNHTNIPIALLKIAGYMRGKGCTVKLCLLSEDNLDVEYDPEVIFINSIFTYWSSHVRHCVNVMRSTYPSATIVVGGIYATLHPEHCKEYTECDIVYTGLHPPSEQVQPAYDLLPFPCDTQIIHTSRGCIRNCKFCSTYKVEPHFICKKTIKDEINKPHIVIYDNNLLANPYIEDILLELIKLRKQHKIKSVESQSGFDGRIMTPRHARLLYKAGFKNIKIAWDNDLSDKDMIHEQIQLLINAGFNPRYISVFVLFNHDLSFDEVEEKRACLFRWGVQITNCRYVPTDCFDDNYNPHKNGQSEDEYYVHDGWTDALIRQFLRNCRRHNMCIRFGIKFHSKLFQLKKCPKEFISKHRLDTYDEVKDFLIDAWNPAEIHTVK